MAQKPIYKRKTFWGGLGLVVFGVGRGVMGDLAGGGQNILEGITAIFFRAAVAKTEK